LGDNFLEKTISMKNFVKNNLSSAMGIQVPVVCEYPDLSNPEVVSQLRADLRGQSLVYAIHRNNTTDLYVGSTLKPHIRFYEHLISSYHSNEYLQNAFSKYGKENFTLYVLHLIDLPQEASREQKENIMISFEQMYFDLLNPTYNFIKRAGRNRAGTSHSEESKLLMSLQMRGKNTGKTPINKGRKLSEERKVLSIKGSSHRLKKVYFYDEDHNLVMIHNGINIACKAEKCSKATMSRSIKDKVPFRGWIVKYAQSV
jgi:hypothetical protein